MKSHFDSIRGLCFVNTSENDHSLVSASEDCTLRIWDASKFCSFKEASASEVNFEPYYTLRGHSTPIMALAGRDDTDLLSEKSIIITGAKNG